MDATRLITATDPQDPGLFGSWSRSQPLPPQRLSTTVELARMAAGAHPHRGWKKLIEQTTAQGPGPRARARATAVAGLLRSSCGKRCSRPLSPSSSSSQLARCGLALAAAETVFAPGVEMGGRGRNPGRPCNGRAAPALGPSAGSRPLPGPDQIRPRWGHSKPAIRRSRCFAAARWPQQATSSPRAQVEVKAI